MSATHQYPVAKGAGDLTTAGSLGRPTKKQKKRAFERAGFDALFEQFQKDNYGADVDQILYWDPLAKRSQKGVNLKESAYENEWKHVFGEVQKAQYEHPSAAFKDVVESVVKDETNRMDFSLPIYFEPDLYLTDRRQTPVADLIPRAAVQEDTIRGDDIRDIGDASSFDEPDAFAESEVSDGNTWPKADDDYNDYEYEVVSYGRQNLVTDFVQLSAQTLRNTRDTVVENQSTAIRYYEEEQALWGTEADADGFDGLYDNVADSDDQIVDETDGDDLSVAMIRENNRILRRRGARREDIVHVTDHKSYDELRDELQDVERYRSDSSEEIDALEFGWNTLVVDNTPILESHGISDESDDSGVGNGNRALFSFSMDANYMAMLQDITLHPLGKLTPSERVASDAYGTLVTEAPEHIQINENLGVTA